MRWRPAPPGLRASISNAPPARHPAGRVDGANRRSFISARSGGTRASSDYVHMRVRSTSVRLKISNRISKKTCCSSRAPVFDVKPAGKSPPTDPRKCTVPRVPPHLRLLFFCFWSSLDFYVRDARIVPVCGVAHAFRRWPERAPRHP